ncbi:PepSY-associated TM helix domain-containing protein [Thalassolituus alkanivorans]|uniref:PepSY-associated TM helix domain-containing protein n=1 Tax=Thalassolituus alkanivorans TaxID=2881055 RepID=UPI001E4E6A51|nr:PepSY-associated TM helix domain-containing protein [Thalassolituus alkanivorans]MCB2385418.1 PepSY-associated TM helix domain-containing protein [Thalassolituus alkanivorans]MCB2422183.1 PepSY-associated TM helix domain-containing protein [Thalassolituus alkanivorans]
MKPVTAVVWQDDAYQLQIGQDWFALDLLSYQLMAATAPAEPAAVLQVLPAELAAARNESISWQRVLLDLHSGRWFGSWGVWVVDVAALILLFLALSGAWIWFSRKRGF